MTTPVRRQYLQIKRQYPDTLLLFRLGDFYEAFDEDAKTVARELDIVLTSRPVGKDQRVPLAGVPYHAVDGYIAKLIANGHKVAICEQIGNEPIKGLVPREVVRVITPGTVVEPSILNEKANNYLAALVVDSERAGLAYADISTGEFFTTELPGGADLQRAALEELARLQPAEILMPLTNDEDAPLWLTAQDMPMPISAYERWRFDYDNAHRALLEHFGVASLAGFGCEGLPLATRAAGAIVQYLLETQKGALEQLSGLATYSISGFMTLDAATRRNLELTQTMRTGTSRGSLLKVLDKTATPMGARTLVRWLNQPLLSVDDLDSRLDCVEALHRDSATRAELATLLNNVADLERLTNRVIQGIVAPRDLVGIRQSLAVIPTIRSVGQNMDLGDGHHPLQSVMDELDPCERVCELLSEAITDSPPATLNTPGIIRPGFSAELDHVVAASRDAKEWVANLEQTERKRSGIKTLKVGYNKVFGYYIEVTKSNIGLVPAEYIRKQTLVNAERYITPQLKEYESLILNAQEQLLDIERRIFSEICDQIAAGATGLLATARALAQLDVYLGLAEVAFLVRYVRPTLTESDSLDIEGGRHRWWSCCREMNRLCLTMSTCPLRTKFT